MSQIELGLKTGRDGKESLRSFAQEIMASAGYFAYRCGSFVPRVNFMAAIDELIDAGNYKLILEVNCDDKRKD